MKRIAFTILLNGLEHLQHNDYYNALSSYVDLWIIIEGVALPGGSTSWCNTITSDFHNNYLSNDGTTEFLDTNLKSNVSVIRLKNTPWQSKDQQVNAGINLIKEKYTEGFLWQVDIDEQWDKESMESAEQALLKHNGKTGCFTCNYFVGKNQQVFGEWGENTTEPYRRLWHWKGENFKTHEPPTLEGKNGPGLLLPHRFNHYSYFFEKDVTFKEKFYGGYDGLLQRWKKIQNNKNAIPVKELLGDKIRWSFTNTIIKYTGDAC